MRAILDNFRNSSKNQRHSSYWFNDSYYDAIAKTKENGGSIANALRLAAFKRSCANFVHILTGRPDIKVRYAGEGSYTDGTYVNISADITTENFDSTVGLALHEASHIVYTDFKYFSEAYQNYDTFMSIVPYSEFLELAHNNIEGFDKYADKEITYNTEAPYTWIRTKQQELMFILYKDMLNWIEDRRIDFATFQAAPGYRPYYTALYDRYWAKEIDKKVKSKKLYRSESVDSYMFRIFALLNKYSDSNALGGLREIEELIDLPNIGRLKSTKDVADITIKVVRVILTYSKRWFDNDKNQKMFGSGKMSSGSGSGFPLDSDEDMKDFLDLLRGTLKKEEIDEAIKEALNLVKDSNAGFNTVGGPEINGKVDVMTFDSLNESIMQNPSFSNLFNRRAVHTSAVEQGLALGVQLGHKLQLRNEDKTLKFTRQAIGKIERRLVHALAHDSTSIFSRTEVEVYPNCDIHVSIDASGSMQYGSFDKAMITAVAIAKACSMVKNIHCSISFRSTYSSDHLPVVYIAYDSKKDGIAHIKKYFPRIKATGGTPESLCFEALQKKYFPKNSKGSKFMFVNISDGCPEWSGMSIDGTEITYSDTPAANHCRKVVRNLILNNEATIMSYLIGGDSFDFFSSMYGKENSFCIDEAGIVEIARTLNRKFLEMAKLTKTL